MKKINILLADDHKMFRDGLKEILNKERNIIVVDEADDKNQIMNICSNKEIDIVIMDIDMGETNGITTTKELLSIYPHLKILVLSMHSDSKYILSMLEAGAKGYILKNAGKQEMITAINTVATGDSYFSSQVSSKIIEQLNSRKNIKAKLKSQNLPLTPREVEVLKLIAQEYSNTEIAEELYISIRTVDTHRRNLLEKLGVKNTAGLVKYALNNNLVG
ncbi:MAG: response regulator [Bacteroidales bacterium]